MRRTLIVVLALSALAVAARAEDVDPEPPGNGRAELRKLRGKWTLTRRVFGRTEKKGPFATTYEFDGNKVTVANANSKYAATVKVDAKKNPLVLHLTREDTKTTSRIAFKIDKGELFLVFLPPKNNAQADEDFSGMSRPLVVLTREKQKKWAREKKQ